MSRFSVIIGVLLAAGLARSGDWPQFRGPGGVGISTETDLPTRWSATENIRWKAPVPGRGVSCPVVVGGRVYLTACTGPAEDRLQVLCFDAASGKQLWSRQFWASGNTICHLKTCMAAPTPVADKDRVFALFASGDLFCLDKKGSLLWCRTLAIDYPGITNHIGMAASPVLVGDLLIVTQENPGESLALGIETLTGRNRWKVNRPRENSWTTPLAWQRPGGLELVLQSGPRLSAHDPKTGAEIWNYSDKELSKIPSPVAAGGLVLVPTREELLAIRPAKDSSGAELAWRSPKLRATTATPLVQGSRFFVINSTGILACGDVASGKTLWQQRIAGPFSASPILSNGKLYLVNESGQTSVVDIAGEPRVLATNDLDETVLATPALADGAIFMRSVAHLYCIGTRKSAPR